MLNLEIDFHSQEFNGTFDEELTCVPWEILKLNTAFKDHLYLSSILKGSERFLHLLISRMVGALFILSFGEVLPQHLLETPPPWTCIAAGH